MPLVGTQTVEPVPVPVKVPPAPPVDDVLRDARRAFYCDCGMSSGLCALFRDLGQGTCCRDCLHAR